MAAVPAVPIPTAPVAAHTPTAAVPTPPPDADPAITLEGIEAAAAGALDTRVQYAADLAQWERDSATLQNDRRTWQNDKANFNADLAELRVEMREFAAFYQLPTARLLVRRVPADTGPPYQSIRVTASFAGLNGNLLADAEAEFDSIRLGARELTNTATDLRDSSIEIEARSSAIDARKVALQARLDALVGEEDDIVDEAYYHDFSHPEDHAGDTYNFPYFGFDEEMSWRAEETFFQWVYIDDQQVIDNEFDDEYTDGNVA